MAISSECAIFALTMNLQVDSIINYKQALLCCILCGACLSMRGEVSAQVMEMGRTFLLSKGVPSDSLQLEEILLQDECHVLENRSRYGGWVIVADEAYHAAMASPVLAFSPRGRFGTNINNTQREVLVYYGSCLKRVLQRGTDADALAHLASQWQPCAPLLGDIAWSQCRLPIEFGGKSLMVKSGCVGTAEAQLLKYWNHPSRISGDVEFTIDSLSQEPLLCRIDGTVIDWASYPPRMPYEKAAREALERIQAICSMTLSPSYGEGATSADFHQLKYSLVRHFGYSSSMKLLRHEHFDVISMLKAAYADISTRHVSAVGSRGHALLLDGYTDGMFHFNFGWGGISNGFYRLFADECLLRNIIVGIEPAHDNEQPMERTIVVKKAGTLSELLPEDEAMTISKLTIKGKLNALDWRLVRRMAGAVSTEDPALPVGRLQELDLSEARFVESKHYFLRQPASSVGIGGTLFKTQTERIGDETVPKRKSIYYDFHHLTHKMFTDLKGFDTPRLRGFMLEEEVPDEKYWALLMFREDCLSVRMFCGCDNLRSITFGKDITHIDHACFLDCANLEHLVFLGREVTFSDRAFSGGSRRLRSIATHSRKNLKAIMFKRLFNPSRLQILTPEKQ